MNYDTLEDAMDNDERDMLHKTMFPSNTTFKGRRWAGWDKNSRERTMNKVDKLVISHNDADGLVSGALFIEYWKQQNVEENEFGVINIDYGDIEETFEYIVNSDDTDISELYVTDLNLDSVPSIIEDVVDEVDSFTWLDHHQWDEKEEQVSNMGVEIIINEDRAAAGIVHQYLKNNGLENDSNIQYIVKITEDHDLWNHEMESITINGREVCISQIFSQIAFYSDDDVFMNMIFAYGDDFLEYEHELLRGDDKENGFIFEREKEHMEKVNYIIETETEIKPIGDYTVAFAHGRASPGHILEFLNEKINVDILVHTKPQYPVKASIRGTENFKKCHVIAEKLNGGGHEQAAGCKPENIVETPMEFFEFVIEKGQPLKDEIESVLKEELEQENLVYT